MKTKDELRSTFPILKEASFEFGDGWNDLIWELTDELSQYSFSKHLKAVQIKEKYGGLRYYCSGFGELAPEEFKKAIDIIFTYEAKANKICEQCGRPGEIRNDGGYYITLCDNCFNA